MVYRTFSGMLWLAAGLLAAGSLYALTAPPPGSATDARFRAAREHMLRDDIEGRGVKDPEVLRAMRTVPREQYVPDDLITDAYADSPLPIGYGQTISQPYIVAAMTEFLHLDRDSVVLEVGTGSGYQAAILAQIVKQVYSLEIIPQLAEKAQGVLAAQGYTNVVVRVGDGYFGWKEQAPFDGIIVTAAATHIPPPLLDQLKPGGRMIIPVGATTHVQNLLLVEKNDDGSLIQRSVMPVRFVPLTGGR